MHNKLRIILTTSMVLSFLMLIGCGKKQEVNITTGTTTESTTLADTADTTEDQTTETQHEHSYIETITTEATCDSDGVKTFNCKCGDSYTEVIVATGHNYREYVFNNDATYTADGTETATCTCGLTDTRIAEGSKLKYTYTDLDKIMYAKQSVNVRDLPTKDGNKIGGLSKAKEVKVTGQCKETSWYRIQYDGGVGYVDNSYLQNDKPIEETTTTSKPQANWYDGYERYVWYDMGEYFFIILDTKDEVIPYCNNFPLEYHLLLTERYPDRSIISNGANIVTPTYSVALISALYMSPEGFPIWSIDYPWAK